MRKVFRCYDNDDDGQISAKNLRECADVLDMRSVITEERVDTMIEVGDRKGQGYVDIEDFMWLMAEIGLLKDVEPSLHDENSRCSKESDYEREYRKAKAFEERKNMASSTKKYF